MSAAKVATYATIGAVVVWALKALAIGIAGGLDKSPVEGPLFFIGFLLFVTGVIAIGLALTAGRSVAVRVGGLVATVAVLFVVWLAVDTIVASLAPEDDPHWVWAELQLWIIAVVTAVGWQLWLRRVPAAAEEAQPV